MSVTSRQLAARGLGLALGGLRRLSQLEVMDRYGLRDRVERAVTATTRAGFGSAAAASRTFARVSRPGASRQQPTAAPRRFDLTPTDEQRMLQEAFGDFGARRLRPGAPEADAAAAVPDQVLAESRQLGALVLAVPTDFGGVIDEASTVTAVLAVEALAHGDLGSALAVIAPASVATALARFGDGDQQATYLPAFTGDDPPVAATAIAEPRPLFDPFALATTARRDGDGFVLDGTKCAVPRLADAELLLVAAELDGTGPALFLVESSTPGLSVAPDPLMGLRAAATGRLQLDRVRVPASALLGGGERAVYTEAVHRGRLGWCALAVGAAQAVLDHVVPYVNDRVAFGEPISHRQAVAFTVADIATEVAGMRLATYRAAALADRGEPFGPATTRARTLCAEHGVRIGSHGVQLLGGHGYVTEHPVERWYRDLRAVGVAEGGLLL